MAPKIIRFIIVFCSYGSFFFSFVNVVLIINCFFGGRYRLGKRFLIFLGALIPVSVLINLLGSVLLRTILTIFQTSAAWAETGEELQQLVSAVYALILSGIMQLILFFYFFFASHRKKNIRTFLIAVVLSFLPNLLSTYIGISFQALGSFMEGDIQQYAMNHFMGFGLSTFLIDVLSILTQIVLLPLLYFKVWKKGVRMRLTPWILLLIFLWSNLFSITGQIPFYSFHTASESVQIMSIYLAIFFPVFGISIPLLFAWMIFSGRRKEQMLAQESYLSAELAYIEQYKKNEQETRAFRHDVKNQLALLDRNLSDGKYEESKDYVKDMLGRTKAFSPRFNTGDEMLDCIVSMKCGKMEEEGIEFSCDGVCDGGLSMKPMDLCEIFANAFDNAIEACIREREKRDALKAEHSEKGDGPDMVSSEPLKIDLKITRTDAFFVFKLSNPCDENLDAESIYDPNVIVTSKKDTKHHGFGTKNLLRVVNRYEGMVRAEREGRRFILGITIPRQLNVS